MSDRYEYRVCWRRSIDRRRRTRLYQTAAGAKDFAEFIEVGAPDVAEGSILGGNLIAAGEVEDLHVERRTVGPWEPIA